MNPYFASFSSEIVMRNANMILNKQLKIAKRCRTNLNLYLIVCFVIEVSFFVKIFASILELHDLERQVPDLRKKADDERAKKEAVSRSTKCN